jgi:hypothetical protein
MKKLIFSLLILFISLYSYSQTSKEDCKFNYGFKLGLVSAYQTSVTLINHEEYSSDNRLGMDIGGFIEFLNYKNFSLLTEAHFIQKGFRSNISTYKNGTVSQAMISSEIIQTKINYLSFNLLGKFSIPFLSIKPYLIAGPRLDKLLSYSEDNLNGIYKYINKYNWGISVGFGISKSLSRKIILSSEFRFSKDFTGFKITDYYYRNIYQYTYGNEVSATFKNNSFEFLLGIAF